MSFWNLVPFRENFLVLNVEFLKFLVERKQKFNELHLQYLRTSKAITEGL